MLTQCNVETRFVFGSVTLLLSTLTMGCLDPLVSDEPGFSPRILPAGAVVPSIEEDPALARTIEESDGLEGNPVSRRAAFAAGQPVYYWDFGDAPARAVPFWSFKWCDADGNPLRGDDAPPPPMHPALADSAPGDADYSPYWQVVNVCVTERWSGEQMATYPALEDAVELGLVREPRPSTFWFNCPFVLPSALLEVGGSAEPAEPHGRSYYRGFEIPFFSFENGQLQTDEDGAISNRLSAGKVYLLRRQSDTEASQTVFQHARTISDGMGGTTDDLGYIDAVEVHDVVVTDDADLSMLTSEAAIEAAAESDPPTVLSIENTRRTVNWPQQSAEGQAR